MQARISVFVSVGLFLTAFNDDEVIHYLIRVTAGRELAEFHRLRRVVNVGNKSQVQWCGAQRPISPHQTLEHPTATPCASRPIKCDFFARNSTSAPSGRGDGSSWRLVLRL